MGNLNFCKKSFILLLLILLGYSFLLKLSGDRELNFKVINFFSFLKFTSFFMILLLSSACANFDQNLGDIFSGKNKNISENKKFKTNLEIKINDLQNQINILKTDLDNLRPNINELTEIDEEIRKLLSELTKKDNDQKVENKEKIEQENKKQDQTNNKKKSDENEKKLNIKGPISLTPKKTEQVTTEKQLGIHLASFRKIELARKSWPEIQKKYGDILIGLDYKISSKNIKDKGKYFRLKAGPFIDKQTANETCKLLSQKKAYCKITDFAGEK